jgi:rubrerythrin
MIPEAGPGDVEEQPEPLGDAGQSRYLSTSTASSLQRGFTGIAERFEALANAEKSHAGRFVQGLRQVQAEGLAPPVASPDAGPQGAWRSR